MIKNTSMWIYAWDLIDEGIPEVLDRLKENNINGINVPTLYHSGRFFLPHNPKRKVYFPEPGALYFPPDETWYGKIRIKPPVSRFASRSFWETLREETRKRDMTMTAWTLALHNSDVGFRYPDTNVRDAFDGYRPTALSPANKDMRVFLVELAKDLARNYEFDNILLESLEYMPLRHGYTHEVFGIPISPTVEFFMTLSFDPELSQEALARGIDIEAVKRFVKDVCAKELDDPYYNHTDMSWEEIYGAVDGELGKYLDLREDILVSLMKDIHKAVRAENTETKISILDFGPLFALRPYGTTWQNGVNLNKWAPYIDEVHPTFYGSLEDSPDKVDLYLSVLNALDKKVAMVPAIRCTLPQVPSREALQERIALVKPHSHGLTFYNYGFMPHRTLEWIKDEIE